MPETLVRVEPTPNPNAVRFMLNRAILQSGSKAFRSLKEAESNPLAKAIFETGPIDQILISDNSILVTKKIDENWGNLIPSLEKTILKNLS